MKTIHAVIVNLLELVDDLNDRAREIPSDIHCAFRICIQSPDDASGIVAAGSTVRIEITYDSGGGEESSYVIQDAVDLKLSESEIVQVYYEEEGLQSAKTEVSKVEMADGTLLGSIKSFCESRLPADDFPLEPPT